ncbi:MAG: hypothetical protein WAX89_04885, partial [Alphaproteobacteria bacterium]
KKEQQKQTLAKKKRHPALAEALSETEHAMTKLTEQKKLLEKQMATPDSYKTDKAAQDAQFTYGKLLRELETVEEQWLAAQAAFDAAE